MPIAGCVGISVGACVGTLVAGTVLSLLCAAAAGGVGVRVLRLTGVLTRVGVCALVGMRVRVGRGVRVGFGVSVGARRATLVGWDASCAGRVSARVGRRVGVALSPDAHAASRINAGRVNKNKTRAARKKLCCKVNVLKAEKMTREL